MLTSVPKNFPGEINFSWWYKRFVEEIFLWQILLAFNTASIFCIVFHSFQVRDNELSGSILCWRPELNFFHRADIYVVFYWTRFIAITPRTKCHWDWKTKCYGSRILFTLMHIEARHTISPGEFSRELPRRPIHTSLCAKARFGNGKERGRGRERIECYRSSHLFFTSIRPLLSTFSPQFRFFHRLFITVECSSSIAKFPPLFLSLSLSYVHKVVTLCTIRLDSRDISSCFVSISPSCFFTVFLTILWINPVQAVKLRRV